MSTETLIDYYPYVCQKWNKEYFHFDDLKQQYNELSQAADILERWERKYNNNHYRNSSGSDGSGDNLYSDSLQQTTFNRKKKKRSPPITSQQLENLVVAFDQKLANEINRLSNFIKTKAQTFSKDLDLVLVEWDQLDNEAQQQILEDEIDKTLRRNLQHIYENVTNLGQFLDLNRFLICKMAKKFERLLAEHIDCTPTPLSVGGTGTGTWADTSGSMASTPVAVYIRDYCQKHDHLEDTAGGDQQQPSSDPIDLIDTVHWVQFPSCYVFSEAFVSQTDYVEKDLKQRCIDVYSSIFRRDHKFLAVGELTFIKSRDQDAGWDRFKVGLKAGITLALVINIIFDSTVLHEFQFPIWKSYGMYVFTTFGNILLFKTLWAMSVGIWSHYNINYISLFKLRTVKVNTMKILNEAFTVWIMWAVSLSIFFQANSVESILYSKTLSIICPLALILFTIIYRVKKLMRHGITVNESRGLFTKEVVLNCLKAPFVKVTFRDNVAADILTSFTRVINDGIYSAIWILSGAFANPNNDMDSNDKLPLAAETIEILIQCVVCYVLAIRMMQCLRNYYDTDRSNLHPHVYNALKYASAMIVVVYGMFRGLDAGYYFFIVWATLYKWWWDVVMDWGLETLVFPFNSQNLQHKHPLLRQKLLYSEAILYTLAILVDLALRAVWIFSLVPTSTIESAFGPMFSVYLGSVEILRRFMWSLLRVEWEHLKFASQSKAGYRIPSAVSDSSPLQALLIGGGKGVGGSGVERMSGLSAGLSQNSGAGQFLLARHHNESDGENEV